LARWAKADVANLGAVTEKLGNLGSVLGGSVLDKDSLDIDAYVTNKAMDGLFKIVADCSFGALKCRSHAQRGEQMPGGVA
jgi:hypothetical protein